MPGLMHGAEQASEDIRLVVAGGQTHVPRHPFGEGMFAFIQPAAIEVETHGLHDVHDQRALATRSEFAFHRQRRVCLLHGNHFADQRWQAPRNGLEDRIDIVAGNTRAVLIDEGVVGREVQRLAEQRRLVPHQHHHLFQVRGEDLEAALGTRLQPMRLSLGGRMRQTRHEIRRRRDGVIALAAHFAQIGDLPVIQTLGIGVRPIQQARDLRCREQRVVFGLQRGQLFAAQRGAATRHHHRCVPVQERNGATEGVEALELLFKLLVRWG